MGILATILVIDDQVDLLELVQRRLRQEGFDVIVATDGRSGLEIARSHAPDLVVLDLTMPNMDGLDVCKAIRNDPRTSRTPVIVLSARASEADRILGLDVGADDYLVKPFSPRELLARVKAVLRRAAVHAVGEPVIQRNGLEIDTLKHQVRFHGSPIALRLSEFRVLEFLATQPGRAFSRDEIIDGALHRETAVTERTIDVHVAKIRQSLGAGEGLIETVRGVGYRFRGET